MQLFNRALHRQRRDRAASQITEVDFLLRESGDRLADRLHDMQRQFPLMLELGCHHGILAETLLQTGKVESLLQADFSEGMIAARHSPVTALVLDEEYIPFAPASLDAVISNLSLHWVNDLVGTLIQLRHALRPDGLFLAVVPGPRTLQELRESFMAVALATGRAAPRISPFVEVRDAGALLQRAGFALPVVDSETITLTYETPMKMLQELRMMGEANCLREQHQGLTTAHFWAQVLAHYQQHYSDERGRVKATVELVFMTAWVPHESQQQPAKRGSGQVSLAKFFAE